MEKHRGLKGGRLLVALCWSKMQIAVAKSHRDFSSQFLLFLVKSIARF